MSNRNLWKKKLTNRKKHKGQEKFSAVVDKNTSLTMYKREGGLYLIIKKDLADLDVEVSPSEAPVINQYLKTPDPFEAILVDAAIGAI